MKHNKLLTLSLLASFLILVSASFSFAQSVTYTPINVCPQPEGSKVYVSVSVDNGVSLAALDIVGQVVSVLGGVDLIVTDIAFSDRLDPIDNSTVLDLRYGLSFCDDGEFRFGAVKLTGTDLAAGGGQIATLELEFVSDCLLGSASIAGATADCGIHAGVSTAFVGSDATPITPTVNAGSVTVVNTDPEITFCPSGIEPIYWKGGSYFTTITAEDDDTDCGCDELSYSVNKGSITSGGAFSFFPTSSDIGCNHFVVTVEDNYGGTDVCEFDISVLNEPPVFTNCPEEYIQLVWGSEFSYFLTADDPDDGPSALTFDLVDFTGPGNFAVDVVSGEATWTIEMAPEYLGTFTAEVTVTDHAKIDACNTQNSDTCTFDVHVSGFAVTIQKHEGNPEDPDYGKGVYQGHQYDLSVSLDAVLGGAQLVDELGGFDFLIAYDASALTLLGAEKGVLLTQERWEYFTYRFGPFGNCGNGCPSGMVRVVAMAETNDGPAHPDPIATAGELFKLTFLITNDRTFECMYAPVLFYWLDCGDNAMSSFDGRFLYVGDAIWSFDPTVDPLDPSDWVFGYFGAEEECYNTELLDPEGTLKEYPLKAMLFVNGGFDIICGGDIDDVGDINLNGLAYEISDAVMFTNYFVNGLSAFAGHVEGSIAASDANRDGKTLSVADLVYLIRVITGDALPYAKLNVGTENITVSSQTMNGALNVSCDRNAGAALMVFDVNGSVGEVALTGNNTDMDMQYSLNGSELRVLVYNIGKQAIEAGNLLTIPVNGNIELVSVEAADYDGNNLQVSLNVLPTEFGLGQNYPNPFNPKTTIALSLPVASDYMVSIYNVAGQLVWRESGSAQAGTLNVVWDGQDMNP